MSNIIVDFEVLPEEMPGDRSAARVCKDLQAQLQSPRSPLRAGEFSKYAAHATLSGPDGGVGPWETADADFGDAIPVGSGAWASSKRAPYDGDGAARYGGGGPNVDSGMGLSNTELVDRIHHLEQQVARTANGGRLQDSSPRARHRPVETEALEEKCSLLQQRLNAAEQELRDGRENVLFSKARAEQAELRLRDREQLLAHAKDMWMKESGRASKLAEALTSAEDKLADQERRLSDTIERYERAQQEVRQLQHLCGGSSSYGFGGGMDGGGHSRPGTTGSLRQDPFLNDDGGDFGKRARPSSDHDLAFAENRRAAAQMQACIEAMPPAEAETNADRFRRLCLLNDAVLYEDDLIQIGVKAEYSGRDGHVGVYFGNKGNGPLQAFTVQYYTVHQDQQLQLTASPISQTLESDQQIVQRITIVLLEPFAEAPWMRIQFLLPDNSPRRIQTRLPVVITKFMIGRDLSQTEFFRIWRQQQFVVNEVTSIANLAARLQVALVHVARSLVFGGALRLHHGVDQNPDNFVLVSHLPPAGRAGLGAPGGSGYGDTYMGDDAESGLALIRVEVGSGRFTGKVRVVIRSDSHTLARALSACIVMQLGDAAAPMH